MADGGSCELWSDFFAHPDTRVIGLDLVLPEVAGNHPTDPRITLRQGDQSDTADLRAVASLHGPFDIVIDDGHIASRRR